MSLVRIVESPPVRVLQGLSGTIQSPLFSGTLLALLLLTPAEVRQRLFPASLDVDVARKVLQVLLGVGIVKTLNRGLSALAANNYRLWPAKGWDWPREIALVTGGSSGIGLCLVQRLVARRVRVVILDLQPPPKELLAAHGDLVRFYQCDVTSPESVAEAADSVRRDVGHPTVLVNNAGITRPMPILDMSHDFLRKIFAVNAMCHWSLVQQFLPNMIVNNKGHVVTVASMASFVALPKGADYSATKAAALSFHESLACELRYIYKADSVLTSVAHPNFVRTPLVQDFGHQLERGGVRMLTPDGVAQKIAEQIFARRGAQIIIPDAQAVVCGIRGWPTWLQVFVRNSIGANAVNVAV